MSEAYKAKLSRVQPLAFGLGVLGLIGAGVGFGMDHKQFFHSYLLAYLFWAGISLGSLAILMIQHLTGGGWGFVIRRCLEAAAKNLWLVALTFIPIAAFGMNDLYIWTHPGEITGSRTKYLDANFFIVRTAIYFLIWFLMAFLLRKWSLAQDKTTDVKDALSKASSCRKLSAPGLLVFALTMTFASIDWVMSLDPHWYSTIFGIWTMGGQVLTAFAFMILVLSRLMKNGLLTEKEVSATSIHDLSKLMFAFVILWAYFSLSQLLIMWSANLPEEIIFYVRRREGGWGVISKMLILFHFFLPFFVLLNRDLKRNYRRVWLVAAFILVMRLVDICWAIKPQQFSDHFPLNWVPIDIAAVVGIGGIWLGFFIGQLKKAPLLPQQDPYIHGSFAHGNE